MKNYILLLFITILFLSTSCSVTFTNIVRTDLEKKNIDIENVQFYNSSIFVLQRELARGETGVEEGKVKIRNDKNIEVVKIYKNTPGICVKSEDNTLYIRFEEGENNLIPFSTSGGNSPYYLINSKVREFDSGIEDYSNYPGIDYYGTINYEGKEYYYGYAKKKPMLTIKKKEIGKILKDYRRVKGLKVQ